MPGGANMNVDDWQFWKKATWASNPVHAMIGVSLTLAILMYGVKFLGDLGSSMVMVDLDVEGEVYEALVESSGGDDQIALISVKKRFPTECITEKDEEKTVRIHQDASCIRNSCEPGVGKDGTPIDCEARVEQFLKTAGTSTEGLKKSIEAIIADKKMSHLKMAINSSSDVCPKNNAFVSWGPAETACNEALNRQVTYPKKTLDALNTLYGLNLTRQRLVEDAQKIPRPEPSEDDGWAALSKSLTNADNIGMLKELGNGRSDITSLRDGAPGNTPDGEEAEPLGINKARGWAAEVIAEARNRDVLSEEIGEDVRTNGYEAFTGVLKQGATHLLFFALILILWSGFVGLGGWRRWVAGFALGALVVGFLAPEALESLDMKSTKDAAGKDSESFNSLVGAPFALVAIILDFFQSVIASVNETETQQRILYAALFAAIFFSDSKLALFGAAYGLVVIPRWVETGEFSALAWDLDVFEVAIVLPVVIWISHLVAVLLAVPVVRGVWGTWGNRIVSRGQDIMNQSTGAKPDSGASDADATA